jgi:hypothetical protein
MNNTRAQWRRSLWNDYLSTCNNEIWGIRGKWLLGQLEMECIVHVSYLNIPLHLTSYGHAMKSDTWQLYNKFTLEIFQHLRCWRTSRIESSLVEMSLTQDVMLQEETEIHLTRLDSCSVIEVYRNLYSINWSVLAAPFDLSGHESISVPATLGLKKFK